MSANDLRRILITGATGKQGGALLSTLLASKSSNSFHLVALTRDASSARAQALAKKPNVSVVEGDLDHVSAIFDKAEHPYYGVFSVQSVAGGDVEETQGKALVDAALRAGVQHFVYSSVDRGGPEKSGSNPTPIPHFQSKHNIELHLQHVSASTQMKWTIIRPVAFMDNFSNDFFGKAMASMMELNGVDTKLQLISTADIGVLAAEAFKHPERYASQAISLATDSLTPREIDAIFQKVTGKPQPKTFSFIGRLLKWFMHKELGVMFDWFKENGYGADPDAIKTEYPQMQDFATWLATSSQFRKSQ